MTYTAHPKLPKIEEGIPIPPATFQAVRPMPLVDFVRELQIGQSFSVPQSRASGFALACMRSGLLFEQRPDPERKGCQRFWRVRRQP